MTIETIWQSLREQLEEQNPSQYHDLNQGCSENVIGKIEAELGFSLPESLRKLYAMNDGQEGKANGLFPGETNPCRFLPIREAMAAREKALQDEGLDVFRDDFLPFADNGIWSLYCIDLKTGSIYYLLTSGPDWTLPREWQTSIDHVATSLESFLEENVLRGAGRHEDLANRLVEDLRSAPSTSQRARAAKELGGIGGKFAVESLAAALKDDPNYSVRYNVVRALTEIATGDAVKHVLKALQEDPNENIRTTCLRGLFNIKHPDIKMLACERIARDGNIWARNTAAEFLLEILKDDTVSQEMADKIVPVLKLDLMSLDKFMNTTFRFRLALVLVLLEGKTGIGYELLDTIMKSGELYEFQVELAQDVLKRAGKGIQS
ncbi:MAG: HEAT repeat domain-containing protein [Candidatus Hodarchaeota archaeon]